MSTQHDNTPLEPTFTVRIVRDYSNKDGWVARALSNSKITFIKNIDQLIADLAPGQLWECDLVEEKPNFAIITITHLIRQ